jgi:hypothetical protein
MRELMPEADRPVYERVTARFIAPARAALGDTAWARAEAAGYALTPEAALDAALDAVPGEPLRANR